MCVCVCECECNFNNITLKSGKYRKEQKRNTIAIIPYRAVDCGRILNSTNKHTI